MSDSEPTAGTDPSWAIERAERGWPPTDRSYSDWMYGKAEPEREVVRCPAHLGNLHGERCVLPVGHTPTNHDWGRAPSPPLPWVEHPDAWWQVKSGGKFPPAARHSWQMAERRQAYPDAFARVAVIPWDLIKDLEYRWGRADEPVIIAILDAADGAR